jgi:hypothetical protein
VCLGLSLLRFALLCFALRVPHTSFRVNIPDQTNSIPSISRRPALPPGHTNSAIPPTYSPTITSPHLLSRISRHGDDLPQRARAYLVFHSSTCTKYLREDDKRPLPQIGIVESIPVSSYSSGEEFSSPPLLSTRIRYPQMIKMLVSI